jgi:hypothetical protein
VKREKAAVKVILVYRVLEDRLVILVKGEWLVVMVREVLMVLQVQWVVLD